MSFNFEKIASAFLFEGDFIRIEPHGHGHINDTYAVYFSRGAGCPARYILQRVNRSIFKDPMRVMDNIAGVTEHIAKKIAAEGGDPAGRVLTIVKSRSLQNWHIDDEGNFWRAYLFIEGATSHQQATPALFEQSGTAFGRFAGMLADYPAHTLHESIPNFHNTRARFEALLKAAADDTAGRAAAVRKEIDFALAHEADASVLVDMLARGELPLRVTHNDTKLNNVMIDNRTGEGVCVIDLDTVMPGLSLYDFGDSIRFGASTGAEDEQDLSKISMSLELFEAFARGYLSQARAGMTAAELEMLPFAAKLMTFECGIRFLADYLNGDVYFKTARPAHNLDRCRTQFKLVSDIETKLGAMADIIKKYTEKG